MLRRDFLKQASTSILALGAPLWLCAQAARAAATRAKITDIKVLKLRVVKEVGSYTNTFRRPPGPVPVRIGGGSVTQVITDQGVIGMGDGIPAEAIPVAKSFLLGKDPFDIGEHWRWLHVSGRWGNNVEVALWDLIGKLANQPLAKLWGQTKDRIMPYGAEMGLGDGPEERARTAAAVKEQGFKCVKLRASFPTMKEDIRLVDLTRKAVGDDFLIVTDANKAGPYGQAQLMTTIWDYQRCIQTALEFQRMGVYWLEEPLGRDNYEDLARLHRDGVTSMHIAGGEVGTEIRQFRSWLEMGSYDIVQPDIANVGPTLFRQVMDLAVAFNRRVTPHAGGFLSNVCHIHAAASHPQLPYGDVDTAPHMECDQNPPLQDIRNTWSVFETPPMFKDGWIHVPQQPGLGVTIQKDVYEKT